jgi:hypothetical protein
MPRLRITENNFTPLLHIRKFCVYSQSSERETDMARQKPVNYRGFSIEQERDGTFSIYRSDWVGYVQGNFRTAEEAQKDIDRRVG